MRALIITGRMVQDQELVYPLYRLKEADYDVDVAAEEVGFFHGIQGVKFRANLQTDALFTRGKYDVVVVPGGVKCMEHLRLNEYAVNALIEQHQMGAVIAATCSGPLLLVSAGLVKGRHVACYPAWKVDIENAGGTFVDKPAVVDDRVVTSTHYKHLGPWMAAALLAVQGMGR